MKSATKPSTVVSELQIARNTYDESVRVTEAFGIQLGIRKRAMLAVPGWDTNKRAELALRVEECQGQLEAAERREYACWQQVEHLRTVWLSGADHG
jgi:hypothetical protein